MIVKILEVLLTIFLLAGCNAVIEEKSGDVAIDNSQVIIVAEFHSMNWGLISSSEDYFVGDYYTLYSNGECDYYRMYNISGKKDEAQFTIPEGELKSIVAGLERNYNKTHNNATDGTGWKFNVYGMDGTDDKKSTGYIYGTALEDIIKKVDSYK